MTEVDFLQSFKQELFFILFCLVLFSFVAAANFSSASVTELEVKPTQILESADEVFCAAEVQALQRVLFAGSAQCASSALLLRTCLP